MSALDTQFGQASVPTSPGLGGGSTALSAQFGVQKSTPVSTSAMPSLYDRVLAARRAQPQDPAKLMGQANADISARTDETMAAYDSGKQGLASTGMQVGGQLLQHALTPLTVPLGKIAGDIGAAIPENADVKQIAPAIGKGFEWLTSAITDNPKFQAFANSDQGAELQKNMEAMSGYLGVVPAGEGVGAAKSGVEAAIPKVTGAIGSTVRGVKNTLGGIKDTISGKVKSLATEKTEAEILATPETDLPKLSPTERGIYNKAQQDASDAKFKVQSDALESSTKIAKQNLADEFRKNANMTADDFSAQKGKLDQDYQAAKDKITQGQKDTQKLAEQKHAELETKVNAGLDAKTIASEGEIKALSDEVQRTAQNKTIELKPKAVKLFGDQSKTYQSLIEEDLAPHKDVPASHDVIANKIDEAFPDNPGIAESMKAKLDLSKGGQTTMGELYQKTKDLRQDISKAGVRGGRSYTADDMNLDKTINVLSKVMSESGVDLSRANKFWSQWAPLRDKIVTKLKPFDSGNLETKSFSSILTNGDIHNENFISALEEKLGEPITAETRAAMGKLSDAKAKQLAAQLDAEAKISDAKIAKEQAIADSKQMSQITMQKLEDQASKASEALSKAKTESDRGLVGKKVTDTRKLQEDYAQAKKALADAKERADSSLESQQNIVKLKAENRTNIIRIAKIVGGFMLFEGAKKFIPVL